jgi:hypothetical protein
MSPVSNVEAERKMGVKHADSYFHDVCAELLVRDERLDGNSAHLGVDLSATIRAVRSPRFMVADS